MVWCVSSQSHMSFTRQLPHINIHIHPQRDDLRKNMINTHVAMVVALLGLMTCLLAANILVLTTSCWWLQPPAQAFEVLNFFDTTFTNIVCIHE